MALNPSPRMQAYIGDVVTNINQEIQFTDNWGAVAFENQAMGWNNAITVEDLDAFFGVGVVTVQQFKDAFNTMQAMADFAHNAQNGPKLYKVKR